ncbi:MAG: MATE family efflux transporter [Candidatus Bipolaricaulota bacterium]|nr:MATE family efflux transporter [Candidatus Bipolaricaulota bacterium]
MEESNERDYTKINLTRGVILLAWPSVVTMMLQMTVGIADIAMAGRLGPEALAAVGLGRQLVFFSFAIVGGLATATTALVAQHYGRQEREEAFRLTRQSLVAGNLISLLVSLGGILFAEEYLTLMGAEPQVVTLGSQYIKIVFAGVIMIYNVFLINAAFRGAGDTRTPMFILVFINAVNIGANYVFMFGVGPFPNLGVAGAGVGTVLSRTLGTVIGWGLFLTKRFRIKLSLSDSFKPRLDEMRRLFSVGAPASMERLIRSTSQAVFAGIVAHLGTMAIAAAQVALRAESFSFMPGFGMAIAATTLVGQNIGAGQAKRAEEAGYRSVYIALAFMSLMGVLFFFFPRLFINLFTSDERVIKLAVPCLKIVAICEPTLALNMVLAGGLRGAADTKFPMYITLAGSLFIRLPLAYLLAYPLGFGLVGAWVAMTVDDIIRGLLMLMRYRTGRWKKKAAGLREAPE